MLRKSFTINKGKKSGKALFILIAILSQFVPWLFIGRILFAYHYFPTVLFLVFAIAYLMDRMLERRRAGYALAIYGFTGYTVALYAVPHSSACTPRCGITLSFCVGSPAGRCEVGGDLLRSTPWTASNASSWQYACCQTKLLIFDKGATRYETLSGL